MNARGGCDCRERWVGDHQRFERSDDWGLASQTGRFGPRSVWSDEPLTDRGNVTRFEAQTSQFLGIQVGSEGNSCGRRHGGRLVEGLVGPPFGITCLETGLETTYVRIFWPSTQNCICVARSEGLEPPPTFSSVARQGPYR